MKISQTKNWQVRQKVRTVAGELSESAQLMEHYADKCKWRKFYMEVKYANDCIQQINEALRRVK